MNTRKLSVAMAAMLLGLQFGSPALAAVSEQEIAPVEAYLLSGQVEELIALLAANPELLQLSGALGDALRSFAAAPTQASLQSIAVMANGQIAIALLSAAPVAGQTSIY